MDWYQFLVDNGFDDWDVDPDGAVFYCPHGTAIEPDGRCPEGHSSPLLSLGMI